MKTMTLLLMTLALGACTVIKVPVATSGSRADGVVTMTFQHTDMETPEVDWELTRQNAAVRCERWGYSSAEEFGGIIRQCVKLGGFNGCGMWQISKDYQCIE